MFDDYVKETGPWRNNTVANGGTDVVTVTFDSALLAVEMLVGAM
jgi:hypothetical protein